MSRIDDIRVGVTANVAQEARKKLSKILINQLCKIIPITGKPIKKGDACLLLNIPHGNLGNYISGRRAFPSSLIYAMCKLWPELEGQKHEMIDLASYSYITSYAKKQHINRRTQAQIRQDAQRCLDTIKSRKESPIEPSTNKQLHITAKDAVGPRKKLVKILLQCANKRVPPHGRRLKRYTVAKLLKIPQSSFSHITAGRGAFPEHLVISMCQVWPELLPRRQELLDLAKLTFINTFPRSKQDGTGSTIFTRKENRFSGKRYNAGTRTNKKALAAKLEEEKRLIASDIRKILTDTGWIKPSPETYDERLREMEKKVEENKRDAIREVDKRREEFEIAKSECQETELKFSIEKEMDECLAKAEEANTKFEKDRREWREKMFKQAKEEAEAKGIKIPDDLKTPTDWVNWRDLNERFQMKLDEAQDDIKKYADECNKAREEAEQRKRDYTPPIKKSKWKQIWEILTR
jgi:hypothetical protein